MREIIKNTAPVLYDQKPKRSSRAAIDIANSTDRAVAKVRCATSPPPRSPPCGPMTSGTIPAAVTARRTSSTASVSAPGSTTIPIIRPSGGQVSPSCDRAGLGSGSG